MSDAANSETSTYTYDDHARLTKDVITSSSNPRTLTFTYDNAGNRKTYTKTGSSPISQSLTYNSGNQISSSGYTYDAAGNRTAGNGETVTFNTAGQMTGTHDSSHTSTYTYAGTNSDELTKEATTGGDTYQYAYGAADQNGLPGIEEITYTPNGGSAASAYVEHDNTGLPVMLETSTGSVGMYVYDGQDNPIGLITNFGSLSYLLYFDPYGSTSVLSNSGGTGYVDNPYGYGGGIQDKQTPYIKFGARWYDPSTGNWIQQATLNAPLDPNNANRYEYAADNPVNEADPSGQDGSGLGGFIGGVVGAIITAPASPVGAAVFGGLGSFLGSDADGDSAGAAYQNAAQSATTDFFGAVAVDVGIAGTLDFFGSDD